ncbi:hypothetical protein EDC04DRAFT_2583292 [Pisolithus marmoratus]|nr:hypothetical protein EDC04DRAFT_2583292 [Pisolithus marmoratus]
MRRRISQESFRPVQHPPTAGRPHNLRVLLGQSLGWRKPKSNQITTAPDQWGAGETETEVDEPPKHLPTSRILPQSEPLIPPSTLTTLLFEICRLSSVVPALVGASINAWCLCSPPGYPHALHGGCTHITQHAETWGRRTLPDRADYLFAVLWALLTAHQCLKLTTGLLHRWRAYYHPLSTLIRLLALQAICWPATHFTLNILGSWGMNAALDNDALSIPDMAILRWTTIRPDVCWAVIGSTTCFSRSIQIWVTSNLLPLSPVSFSGIGAIPGRSSGRRWDWGVVARVCMFPAGLLYVLMAWIGAWRREVGTCS